MKKEGYEENVSISKICSAPFLDSDCPGRFLLRTIRLNGDEIHLQLPGTWLHGSN